MDEVSEFNINYNSNKNDFQKLIQFIEEYQDKRINISISSAADLENLKVINKLHKNIYIKVDNFNFLEQLNNFKYYLSIPITNYTLLDHIINLPISDIYIAGDLYHSLSEVKILCEKHNIRTRLIVNKIPMIGLSPRDAIYRPEDGEYLSNYIDTIEFDCGNDWKKIEVLYKVWIEKQTWSGNLQEINSDLAFYFPNRQVIPYLYRRRYNCNFECIRGDSTCTACEDVISLALEAEQENVIFNKQFNQRS